MARGISCSLPASSSPRSRRHTARRPGATLRPSKSKCLFSQGADHHTCQVMLGMLKEKLARKQEEHHNTVLFLPFLGQFYLLLVLWVSVCVCSSRGSLTACPAPHRCGWPEAGGSFCCPKQCTQRGPAVGYTSKHVPDIVPAVRGSPAEQVLCVTPKKLQPSPQVARVSSCIAVLLPSPPTDTDPTGTLNLAQSNTPSRQKMLAVAQVIPPA